MATKASPAAKTRSIWLYALLYLACYVPYSGLTKALSSGMTGAEAVPGPRLLPLSAVASLVVVVVFLSATRWWRFATQRQVFGRSVPVPTRWTTLSGLCSSVILTTATLAFTFEGVSIVFMLLLMRAGVLILAPIVDLITGRRTRWYSVSGLFFSLSALFVVFLERMSFDLTLEAGVVLGLYLLAYFIRLQFMSRLAKSDDADTTRRYFVEEQLMTTPATFVLLVLAALIGHGAFMQEVRLGFTAIWSSGVAPWTLAIGFFSQLVGIFGTLIFLDPRENTFSVPVNRCSSVLAGIIASFALAGLLGARPPSHHELGGAALVVVAIIFLTLGPRFSRPVADSGASA